MNFDAFLEEVSRDIKKEKLKKEFKDEEIPQTEYGRKTYE